MLTGDLSPIDFLSNYRKLNRVDRLHEKCDRRRGEGGVLKFYAEEGFFSYGRTQRTCAVPLCLKTEKRLCRDAIKLQ